jgi:hypothetical protein
MSLTDSLRALGTRFGLVQAAPATPAPAAPARIATRTLTLEQLHLEVPDPARVAALAAARCAAPASDLALPFAAIDEAAGVAAPAHGWDALRAAALLAGQAGASREQAQAALLAELRAAGVPSEEVVRDACARDQALDAFAAAARSELARRRALRRARLDQLAAARAALDAEAAGLSAQDHADQQHWQAWWQAKLERERLLAAAVGALLDQPLPQAVTVDSEVPPIA